MTKYYMANPQTGKPITFLAEYQGSPKTVRYFDSKQEVEMFAEEVEYPTNLYVILSQAFD